MAMRKLVLRLVRKVLGKIAAAPVRRQLARFEAATLDPRRTQEDLLRSILAYHRDTDRTRTIKEALAQCNRPYVIAKGPSGGVMMNLADQKELSELVLKAGPDGKTYLVPPGDVGTADDRIVTNVDANSFTTNWVDPDNAARYGTSVYERCGQKKA